MRCSKRCVDLFAGGALEAFGAEGFDGERAHDAAVEHGGAEDLGGELALGGDVAVEAAGEGVACAGGVDDFFDGAVAGARKRRALGFGGAHLFEEGFGEEAGDAVLAVLDDEGLGAQVEDLLGGRGPLVSSESMRASLSLMTRTSSSFRTLRRLSRWAAIQ